MRDMTDDCGHGEQVSPKDVNECFSEKYQVTSVIQIQESTPDCAEEELPNVKGEEKTADQVLDVTVEDISEPAVHPQTEPFSSSIEIPQCAQYPEMLNPFWNEEDVELKSTNPFDWSDEEQPDAKPSIDCQESNFGPGNQDITNPFLGEEHGNEGELRTSPTRERKVAMSTATPAVRAMSTVRRKKRRAPPPPPNATPSPSSKDVELSSTSCDAALNPTRSSERSPYATILRHKDRRAPPPPPLPPSQRRHDAVTVTDEGPLTTESE